VVEDSPAQAALVVADLTEAGFEVVHAPDGEAALEHLLQGRISLVLSDVVMPRMDGYELCRRVKAFDRAIPVVLLTSLDDPIEIVNGLDAGADNFLRKPYDPVQLVARIRTMLLHRELRAGGRASMGLEVVLHDKRFMITAERQQILDLLISTFEDLVSSNRELREREAALTVAEARVRAELEATEQERRRIATVLGAAPDAIVIFDPDGRITDVSDRLCTLVGLDASELVGRQVDDVTDFVDRSGEPARFEEVGDERPIAAVLSSGQPVEAGTSFNLFLRRPDASVVPVIARAAPVRDRSDRLIAVVGVLQEIGALAGHDSTTKLPNQALFADRAAQAVEAALQNQSWVAVLAIAIDRFDRLTGDLAPSQVDDLLAELGARLRTCAVAAGAGGTGGSVGSAAYLGGDLFAVLLPDLDGELDGVHRAKQIAHELTATPVVIGDLDLTLSVRLGIAVNDDSTQDAVTLVASAVSAVRTAANGGTGVAVVDAAFGARAGDRLRQEAELRSAIDDGQLVVHYQPEIDLPTGRIWGFEALVRWNHPTRGLLAPDAFLPLAYETGLIVPLGWWVLEEACRQMVAWRSGTLPGADLMTMSVNLDHQQLDDPDVEARVEGILARTGLDGACLVLEVTERGVTSDSFHTAEKLRRLKALGIRIAIDDFGTGFSSLVHLRHFPADLLKVDRSFVSRMTSELEDAAIVASTIRMARELGICAVAEGVETDAQLVQLRLLDCDFAQGFRWTRALDASGIEAWCADRFEQTAVRRSVGSEPTEVATRVDEVLAMIVSELRSPLSVITGYAGLAMDDDGGDLSKFLPPILRSAEQIERRIATLAEARSPEVGGLALRLDDVDVSALIGALVDDLRAGLHPHEVTLQQQGSAVVVADASRLVEAVNHLLFNAARTSPPDAPIDVTVHGSDQFVEITVRDFGPDVPRERRADLFRRAAPPDAPRSGGAVGLALVRSIARAHGGEVRHEPAPGGGSCFRITLPKVAAVLSPTSAVEVSC
jgi:PAS domain S-box-containing protein/diguanylate cyclase (GGDEF)-like protein